MWCHCLHVSYLHYRYNIIGSVILARLEKDLCRKAMLDIWCSGWQAWFFMVVGFVKRQDVQLLSRWWQTLRPLCTKLRAENVIVRKLSIFRNFHWTKCVSLLLFLKESHRILIKYKLALASNVFPQIKRFSFSSLTSSNLYSRHILAHGNSEFTRGLHPNVWLKRNCKFAQLDLLSTISFGDVQC